MEKLNFILSSESIIKTYWLFTIFIVLYIFLFRKNMILFFEQIIGLDKDKKINENKKLDNNKKQNEELDNNIMKKLFFLIELAILFALIIGIWDLLLVNKNIKDFGQWGDFLGGILNPILTFLTFVGLIITIAIQQNELKLSREEFSKSAQALEQQSKHIELQGFENTFFKMVELHNNIVENLSYSYAIKSLPDSNSSILKSEEKVIRGIKVFSNILNNLLEFNSKWLRIEHYKNKYLEKNNEILGQYFRNLYQILRFINKNKNLFPKTIKTYSNILRAQLSTNEVIIIFINAIAYLEYYQNDKKMIKLLIEYSMLKHLPIKGISSKNNTTVLYFKNNQSITVKKDIFKEFFKDNKSAFDGNDKMEEIKRVIR